jgi:hypothetical protein
MKSSVTIKRLVIAACLLAIAGGFSFARPKDGRPLVQIALLLDTSNSMDGLIDQAKSQLWNIVSEAGRMTRGGERAKLEVALYEYGNDANSVFSGYIRLVMPFTNDLDALSGSLFELDTNGGDEYCGMVIKKSLTDLDWSTDAADLRIAYIAGNEPFTQGSVNFRDAGKVANRMGVVVNTIFCGYREEGIDTMWAEGARVTGGSYANINGDYQYEYFKCPQDDRLSELNSRLNDTYIAFGAEGEERKEMQSEQDSMAESLNKEGFFKRAAVKSSPSYSNSSWDLVDATTTGGVPLSSVKESELPEELRAMDKSKREAYVAGKSSERAKIQAEIATLAAERDAYLAAQKSETKATGALDTAILTPLGDLAKAKGFVRTE